MIFAPGDSPPGSRPPGGTGNASRSRAPKRRGMSKSTRQPAGSPECELVGATKEGARAPNDRHPEVTSPATFRRPRAVALRAEVAVTSSARLWSHPMAFNAGLTHQDRWRLRFAKLDAERRCATGRPCVSLLRAHSLEFPRSRHLRRASPRGRRMIAKSAHLNRAPTLPRVRRSAAASLCGQGGASMREVSGAGITVRL